MKLKLVKIANLIMVTLFTLFIAGSVFAWFAGDMINRELEMEGASAAYFESGSGTETDPFIITNERHIYNLAWLNNTGRFGDTKYYFKVNNNIEISSNDWIPPIGTEAHPFYGDFNGNGKTISNLKVTTDKTKLKNSLYGTAYIETSGSDVSESSYRFSPAVGFFGKTAEGSNITNFILSEPTVLVAASDYSTSGNSVVGLAIGHVADMASSIGVVEGDLAVEVVGYVSFNSILGELGVTAQANMSKGDGEIMAGDTGYFVPGELLKNSSTLNKFFSSNGKAQDNHWLVAGPDNTLGLGSFSVSTSSGSDELASANITSFKFYYSQENDTATGVFDSTDGVYDIDLTTEPTDENIKAVWDSVRYVSGDTSTHLSALTGYWYFQNTSNAVTTESITVVNEDNDYMNTDGTVSETAVSAVYNIVKGGLKVNIEKATPANPSKILVIAASRSSTATREVGLYKVYSAQSGSDINYNNFYSGSTGAATEIKFDKENPMMKLVLPGGQVVGCYFNVTEPGVYQLQSTGSGINFYYVSAEGVGDGQGGEPPATERFELDNIDFIEEGDAISQTDSGEIFAGDFVSGTTHYDSTETWVFINAVNATIYVSFTRKGLNGFAGTDTAYTLGITLYSSFDDVTDALSGEVLKTENTQGIPVYEDAGTLYGIKELPFIGKTHKVQELEGNDIPNDITVGPTGLSVYKKYIGNREIAQADGTITVTLDDFEIDLLGNNEGYTITSKIISYNGAEIDENGIALGVGYHTFVIEVTCSNGTETKTFSGELSVIFVETSVYHSVTFDANLPGVTVENMPEDYDVKDGETMPEPSEPKAVGYTFGGWYTDSDCTDGNEFDFANTQIIKDTTLYAKWIEDVIENHYSFDALAAAVSDPANANLTIGQEAFTGVNSFITVVPGGTVAYRGPDNNVLEIKNEALSVTFQGTGTLVIQARSTGNSNTSSIAIKGPDGNYIEGTYTSANVQKDDNLNVYTVTGAMNEIFFVISQPGTYTFCTLSSVTVNGSTVSTARNTRIGAIDMIDNTSTSSVNLLSEAGQSVETVSTDFASLDLIADVNKKK